ncbi:MAG: MBL fold metallo-hydrolase [Microscillaceae bacterium]|nr:MBL fold metallo-hydrolase [Microscillaceae bacterium]
MLQLTILGSNAASPAFNRHPTAQVLTLPYARFLIDCGEGTQMQLMRYRIKANRIARIFITHLHGDHYLGLVGLLSTMHLLKRTQDLHIHGPRELAEIIRVNLYHSQTVLNYPVHFHPVPLQGGEVIYDDGQYVVETLLMNHRIPCLGYSFREIPES